MAAPAFGSAGTQLQGSGSTMNVDVPDSVAAGDIIVVTAFIDTAGATVTGLATDFAQAPDSPVGPADNHTLVVMWKRATGADSTAGTYDFTLSGSVYRNAQAIRYTGAISSGDPWDVTNSNHSGTNNVSVTPAVSDTTTVADTLLVWAATNWSGGSWTPPSGFTERRDSGDGVCTSADLAQAAAGATGSITGTSTSTDKSVAWLGALKGANFPTLTAQNPTADSSTGGAATSGDTAATSHTVVLPATVAAGDLLMVFGRVTAAGAVAVSGGGWTLTQDSSDSSDDVTFWGYRDTVADGTEDGSSITVTHASGKMAAATMAIAGAAAPGTQAPQASTVAVGTSTTPNPTTCTPSGGAKDYLWIWFGGWEGEQTLSKTQPTNYTDHPDVSTGTGGVVASNAQIKTARRELNAASEDPGSVTLSGSDDWTAWVIAVHPASAAADAPAGNATGTGTANQVVAQVGTNAGLAAGTGVANQATVSTVIATNAPAGLAAGTGVANAPAVALGSTAGAAAGTGTANPGSASLGASAGAATATGVANPATVSTVVQTNAPAGAAAATGTAFAPTIAVRVPAGVAAASGAANSSTGLVGARAGVAAGTGTANAATVMTGGLGFAGSAAVTVSAFMASSGVGATAGPALVTATAPAAQGHGDLPVEQISDPLGLTAVQGGQYLGAVADPLTIEALED